MCRQIQAVSSMFNLGSCDYVLMGADALLGPSDERDDPVWSRLKMTPFLQRKEVEISLCLFDAINRLRFYLSNGDLVKLTQQMGCFPKL